MPSTRQGILRLTYGTPDRWWYLTELAETLQTSPSSLQRELDSLTAAAILEMRREGRRTYYRANEDGAIFDELRQIVRKVMGIPEQVGRALRPLKRKIVLAIVYGSVARGDARADSDVDVLVVSDDLTLEDLYKRLAASEKKLSRKINPTLLTTGEFRQKRRTRNSFLERILASAHVVLIGDVDAA